MTHQGGFTIIELIIVITIMMVLSTFGIASFVTYSRSQDLVNAAQNVSTVLQVAKASASSQVKPSSCVSGTLNAYEVTIDPVSPQVQQYSVEPVCGSIPDVASKKMYTLPQNVSFSAAKVLTFHVITGDVTSSATDGVINGQSYTDIVLTNSLNDSSKTIRVFADGRINIQ